MPVNNICLFNRLSFGTSVTKEAQEDLKKRYPVKYKKIVKRLENDGYIDFILKSDTLLDACRPNRNIHISINPIIYKTKSATKIANAIRDVAIKDYKAITGENPVCEKA